jgi:hypothetical protein
MGLQGVLACVDESIVASTSRPMRLDAPTMCAEVVSLLKSDLSDSRTLSAE